MTKAPIPSHRRELDRNLQDWGERKSTTDEWESLFDDFPHESPYDLAQQLIKQRRRRQQIDVEPAVGGDESAAGFARFVWARSLLLAADADDDEQVQRFRADVLDGRLLPWADVEQWLTRQAELDRASKGGPAQLQQLQVLDYALEGSGWVHRVVVAPGGVLDVLRQLGQRLTKRYGWQPAQATTFVLAGVTPVVPVLRVTHEMTMPGPTRITLTVDPDVPTELVAAAYKRARAKVLGTRARAPLGRGTELAIHAAERPGVDVRGLWRQWNAANPEQPYDTLPGFRQALRDARRRVLGQPRRQR